MRISGGKARGIQLRSLKDEDLRPATEANRERLFSSIGDQISNKRILDLFAGTGSYGLEALSRGAKSATFVEKKHKVVQKLKDNLDRVVKSAELNSNVAKVEIRDVNEFLKSEPIKPFDLIFIDPPYSQINKQIPPIFKKLTDFGFIHSKTLVFHERPGGEYLVPDGFLLIKTLGKERKGTPVYHIFQKPN